MTPEVSSVEGEASEKGKAPPTIRIFISYRRDDVDLGARALWSDLAQHFGEKNVFRDVTGLASKAGEKYEKVIDERLEQSEVEIVLIGKKWANDENRRRLEDEGDLHRREIEGAFSRDIPVIPVLVGGAKMPEAAALPEPLRPLTAIQARALADDRWGHDIEVLIDAIETRAAERIDAIEARRIEVWKAEREKRDRVFMSEAEEATQGHDFERARRAAALIQDPGRRVEALVGIARAQAEVGASEDAITTLDTTRDLAPEIEDPKARAQALALVEVEREECVRDLIKRAREEAQDGQNKNALATLELAQAAAGELEVAAARKNALAEVKKVADSLAEHKDAEREERVSEFVSSAREQLKAGAIEEARAALDSAKAAAEEIEDAERKSAALALFADVETKLDALLEAQRVPDLLSDARKQLEAGAVEEAQALLESAKTAAGQMKGAKKLLQEVSKIEAEIADYRDAEREKQIRELVDRARELAGDGVIEEVRASLDPARAAAEEIENAKRRDTALALVGEEEARRGLFRAATRITGASGSISGDNTAATKEPGEPEHAGYAGGKSVWYRWTAPTNDAVTIDTAGSDFDTLLAVYRGANLAELELVAANNDPEGTTSRVRFPVVESEEYLIAVDGFNGAAGAFVLNWNVQSRPVNDAFAAAEEITGASGSVSGDNTGATKEPGEPEHAGNVGGRSVWFRWTALDDDAVTIDTVGSDFDTLLAVYRGANLTELELVAENDDYEGATSRVRFPVTEGEEYRIAVDGFNGAAGAFVLNWNVQPRLVDLMRATNLRFTEIGDGAVTVPFQSERAERVVVNAKELADGVVFFCVDLPEFSGFGTGAFLKTMLGISYGADYVKALAMSGNRYALAAEVPAATLTSPVCEGLIRGLVALGDVKNQADLLSHWDRRIKTCERMQQLHIGLNTERAREEVYAMLNEAGLSSWPSGFELSFGFETRPLSVSVNPRVISLIVTLQGVKPGNDKQKLRALLDLNRVANVAKVGLDSQGNVVLLYEFPQVVPRLMERVRPQLVSLRASVAEVL